mmetsp:Transcript_13825/g.33535  ORF Transcript_13825/g.33535 Transcript_13825/m.33535 type:complete len:261 (-) Transcript_13825:1426-2208(-)
MSLAMSSSPPPATITFFFFFSAAGAGASVAAATGAGADSSSSSSSDSSSSSSPRRPAKLPPSCPDARAPPLFAIMRSIFVALFRSGLSVPSGPDTPHMTFSSSASSTTSPATWRPAERRSKRALKALKSISSLRSWSLRTLTPLARYCRWWNLWIHSPSYTSPITKGLTGQRSAWFSSVAESSVAWRAARRWLSATENQGGRISFPIRVFAFSLFWSMATATAASSTAVTPPCDLTQKRTHAAGSAMFAATPLGASPMTE